VTTFVERDGSFEGGCCVVRRPSVDSVIPTEKRSTQREQWTVAMEQLGIFEGSEVCGRPTGALCRKDGIRGYISTGNKCGNSGRCC